MLLDANLCLSLVFIYTDIFLYSRKLFYIPFNLQISQQGKFKNSPPGKLQNIQHDLHNPTFKKKIPSSAV